MALYLKPFVTQVSDGCGGCRPVGSGKAEQIELCKAEVLYDILALASEVAGRSDPKRKMMVRSLVPRTISHNLLGKPEELKKKYPDSL